MIGHANKQTNRDYYSINIENVYKDLYSPMIESDRPELVNRLLYWQSGEALLKKHRWERFPCSDTIHIQ